MQDNEELEEFSLEDIIKEFSDHPQEEPEESPETADIASGATEDTQQVPEVPAQEKPAAGEQTEEVTASQTEEEETAEESDPAEVVVSSDTIRLDSAQVLKGVFPKAQPIEDEEEAEETAEEAEEAEEEQPAFTGTWEPEYEQPMGEYVPPQPIVFPTRAESWEMKHKLVVGPEKKYYELTEKGLGKLQLAMLLSLLVVILSAATTIAYAQGAIPENRLRLMIFVQYMAVLVSALLGSFRLIRGVAELLKGHFTLNTLLVISFGFCCADGILCLLQERIPCCAAFSLEMFMSLWSAYHRRHAELGQMDTLRKAARLRGVCAKENAYEGKKVLLRIPGQVEHFMNHYNEVNQPEKRQNLYALIALVFSLGIGVFAGITYDWYQGVQITTISLLAAVPATMLIATTRPFAILQRRLHRLGAVLCGWQGVKQLCGKVIFPIRNEDLFPLGTTRMNGVKFFGSRSTEQVLAYATAVITAEGSGLAPLFQQVLDSRNGRHYDAQNLRHYQNGGIGGTVLDEPVLVGSLPFLKEMGVEVPEGIQVSQAVCVSIDGELCGIFAISYEKTRGATAGLSTLGNYRNLNPVMIDGEFMMSESFIRGKFGMKSKRLQFPDEEIRTQMNAISPDEDAEAALLTTTDGLASMAFSVTGARALRTACNVGVALHMVGGILGMAAVLVLVLLNATHLLTPANMFLYQLVWMIPGLLVTEWTRSI